MKPGSTFAMAGRHIGNTTLSVGEPIVAGRVANVELTKQHFKAAFCGNGYSTYFKY
jgi:hypothetical protein